MLDYVKPDSVIITETKLHDGINTAEIFPDDCGYTVYRRDRLLNRGGGVMLLIKSCYTSNEIKINVDCEVIWVQVLLRNNKKMFISSFYRPPDNCLEPLEQFRDSLRVITEEHSKNPNNIILGSGDYNCPGIDWPNTCVKNSSNHK